LERNEDEVANVSQQLAAARDRCSFSFFFFFFFFFFFSAMPSCNGKMSEMWY